MIHCKCSIAPCQNISGTGIQILEADIYMNEHLGILCPVEISGTLRKLVPDHSRLRVLILCDEFELIPRAGIFACSYLSIGRNQSITCKEPGVLRSARVSGGAVARDDAAAEPRIAHPGLIESNLSPCHCAIHVFVGSA